LADAPDNMA